MMRSRASVHCSECWTLTSGSVAGYGDCIDFEFLSRGSLSVIIHPIWYHPIDYPAYGLDELIISI